MSVTQKRADAAWIAGMDSCIRGLNRALVIAIEREDYEVGGLDFVQNEIDAINEHWERLRGPLPPDPEDPPDGGRAPGVSRGN